MMSKSPRPNIAPILGREMDRLWNFIFEHNVEEKLTKACGISIRTLWKAWGGVPVSRRTRDAIASGLGKVRVTTVAGRKTFKAKGKSQ